MEEIYIYHHLGLGDHIICNAIVRHFSKIYDKIYLFVKKHNFKSVRFMYNDLINIEYIKVNSDIEVESQLLNKNFMRIGFNYLHKNYNRYFDKLFFQQLNIDFEKRWLDFYINRNEKNEIILFDKYNIEENRYIFIHDDKSRNFNINESFIQDKTLKIIRPIGSYTENIFDYCYLLENAKEIHCIDSSFKLIADSIELNSDRLFFHLSYINKDNKFISSSKKNWIII